MFASDNGSVDPKYPVNTGIGKFLVSHGGNVVGSYGYGISPSSTRAAIATVQSVIHAGGKQGVLDTSVPFGGSDFTTAALVAKSKGVNGLSGAMDDNSNFALATALKQAGVKLKAVVFPTGYEPGAITSPAWPDLQGDYFSSLFRPFQLPNASTNQMKSALQKYDSFTKTQFPTFEQYEAWVGADLMIKGMQLAGKNPTSATVTTSLRNIKSYNAGGLLANPINFSTAFGHDPAKTCSWYLQAQSKGYVPVTSQPVCGTDIPGTSTASSS
jgi:branched-chain amino acid transport system substrate-binding protein